MVVKTISVLNNNKHGQQKAMSISDKMYKKRFIKCENDVQKDFILLKKNLSMKLIEPAVSMLVNHIYRYINTQPKEGH